MQLRKDSILKMGRRILALGQDMPPTIELASFYLELFKTTKDAGYLDRALNITKDLSEKDARRWWMYDHKDLANRLAGYLLLCLALHEARGEDWQYDLIKLCLVTLTGRARLAGSGIFWEGNGIAYSLLEAGKYFNDRKLTSIAEAALNCEDESAGRMSSRNVLEDGWRCLIRAHAFGEDRYLDDVERISSVLMQRLEAIEGDPEREAEFFDEAPAIGCFLLKAMDRGIAQKITGECPYPFGPADVNRLILRNNFPSTTAFLEKRCAAEFEQALTRQPLVNINWFKQWADTFAMEHFDPRERSSLEECMEHEMALVTLRAQHRNASYPEDCRFAETLDHVLHLPDEPFLKLTLVVSPFVIFVRKEACIDLTTPFTKESLTWLFTGYGKGAYFLRLTRWNKIEKENLGLLLFFADLFNSPATVASVDSQLLDFVLSQDEAVISLFYGAYNVGSSAELEIKLGETLTSAVRRLLILGVLDLVEEPVFS